MCLLKPPSLPRFAQNDISVLPAGYNFLNKRIMISEIGKEYAMENFNQADARNPDFHDMYIYNGVLAPLAESMFSTGDALSQTTTPTEYSTSSTSASAHCTRASSRRTGREQWPSWRV